MKQVTILSGKEICTLMRKHQKTIGGLAYLMGITQTRVRQVRAKGLDDKNSVRDWVEFITGKDPG
jgi:hypothetical protein